MNSRTSTALFPLFNHTSTSIISRNTRDFTLLFSPILFLDTICSGRGKETLRELFDFSRNGMLLISLIFSEHPLCESQTIWKSWNMMQLSFLHNWWSSRRCGFWVRSNKTPMRSVSLRYHCFHYYYYLADTAKVLYARQQIEECDRASPSLETFGAKIKNRCYYSRVDDFEAMKEVA